MHSSTMKVKLNELPSVMQTMTDMLHDYLQQQGDPAAQWTMRTIQQVSFVSSGLELCARSSMSIHSIWVVIRSFNFYLIFSGK